MNIVDRGHGTPIVLIPGVQGRWEWMKPAVDALARRARVITFSLADEPSCGARFDTGRGFECYVDQVREALDRSGVGRACICGVSYGGLIAATFAARHPQRTTSVVLVSTLPPSWRPDERVQFYLRSPWLLSPLFCLGSLRLYPEIAAATPGVLRAIRAAVRHAATALAHMFHPGRMARRVKLLASATFPDLSAVTAPALVVTGEPALDRVVPVAATLEYLRLWPQARHETLAHTGHLGLITRPDDFVRLVVPFADATADEERRRHVG